MHPFLGLRTASPIHVAHCPPWRVHESWGTRGDRPSEWIEVTVGLAWGDHVFSVCSVCGVYRHKEGPPPTASETLRLWHSEVS